MEILSSSISCGVYGIAGLRWPISLENTSRNEDRYLRYVITKITPFRPNLKDIHYTYIFSDNFLQTLYCGSHLAKLITDNKLGHLVSSGKVMSASTRRYICTYIWVPDWEAIDKWVGEYNKKNDGIKATTSSPSR